MFSLFNPWVIGGALVVMALTHWTAYERGYKNGGAHEIIACNTRINEANKLAEKLGEQWQEGLTAVLDAATKAAGEDDAKNAKLQAELDKYVEQVVAGGGELCLVTDADAAANSLRNDKDGPGR